MKLIDLTGQKTGNLTVIERDGCDKYGHALWRCRCDCGNETLVPGVNLTRHHTISCGCQSNQLINEIGNKYGRLTVIERAENHPINDNTMWLCHCDCGNKTVVHGTSLRNGTITGCGCKHPLPEGTAALNSFISRLKSRAKQKKFEYSLTKEQIWKLSQQPCFYCGVEPRQELKQPKGNGNLIYNGIDRIDNTKGYTIDNVVTCCGVCNHAKATLSQEEFKNLVCRIYKNWIESCD